MDSDVEVRMFWGRQELDCHGHEGQCRGMHCCGAAEVSKPVVEHMFTRSTCPIGIGEVLRRDRATLAIRFTPDLDIGFSNDPVSETVQDIP